MAFPSASISFATRISRCLTDNDPRSVCRSPFQRRRPQHDVTLAVEANIDVMAVARIQLTSRQNWIQFWRSSETLKTKAYDAFEKLITDRTRKLYGR